MSKRRPIRRARRGASGQEGAAMLIVMLVLLLATSTAVFAVHSTTYEIRAAGHLRRSMQTQYVGQSGATGVLAWVDSMQAAVLFDESSGMIRRWSQSRRSSGDPVLPLAAYGEPQLAPNKDGYFVRGDRLTDEGGAKAISREAIGGSRQAFEPWLRVDMYDVYRWQNTVPGYRGDGHGRMTFARVTYTSRGRTRVADTDRTLESASDARAHGLTGPYSSN